MQAHQMQVHNQPQRNGHVLHISTWQSNNTVVCSMHLPLNSSLPAAALRPTCLHVRANCMALPPQPANASTITSQDAMSAW
jgi:hypothetical protein